MGKIKQILIISSILLIPILYIVSPCFAATWEYQVLRTFQQPWGLEALIEFTSSLGETRTVMYRFDNLAQLQAEGSARAANKIAGFEKARSLLNQFDLGENSHDILSALIKYIRNNPNVTLNQILSIYDNQYPEAIWKGEKIIDRAKEFLRDELGFVPTWDQFKTYVINTQFEEID